ncbi:MAG TPA: hypothetical protein VFQ85_15365 [Mycobacteriales bacterium]|nr:hypothetical protein [Mycobacteriales bacterium]
MNVTTAVRRIATVLLTGTLLVTVAGTTANAAEGGHGKHDRTKASHSANADCGNYCSTRDGSPSRNGNGGGKATGRPCAGCVGKADDKNPYGQRPNGSDSNNGYECDGNAGIGRSNPAHTGCTALAPTAAPSVVVAPRTVTVAPPAPAPVAVAAVRGTALVKAAPAAATEAVTVGAQGAFAPEVLGTRLTRPSVAGGTAQGTLPFTGGETTGLLLAAVSLLVVGGGATFAGRRSA